MRGRWLVLAGVLLAACDVGGLPRPGVPGIEAPTSAALILSREGLTVPGAAAGEISFGRAMPGVVEAVRRLKGAPLGEPQTNAECGAGPVTAVRFRDGLTLNFMNGAFLGWVADAPGAGAAPTGVKVGDTWPPPGAAVQETTLGREAEVAGVQALSRDGWQVDLLFAGVTCFFR